jgi:hypothetical protein
VEKSGPPDQSYPLVWGFFISGPQPYQEEQQMEKKEIAFTKQAILTTKDWDAYQAIIRKCLRTPEVKARDKTEKL